MLIKKLLLFFLMLLCMVSVFARTGLNPVPTNIRNQLILVITPNWSSVRGRLWRFQRTDKGEWQQVGKPAPIVVGGEGLAWSDKLKSFPVKKEGDNKSPAGMFFLTDTFGFAKYENTKLPYTMIKPSTVCVSDPKSKFYNRIVDFNAVKADWHDAEPMHEISNYRYGIIVASNSKRISNAGSCIFLHVWDNSHTGTAGCTAMSEKNMKQLFYWVNQKYHPILIQLPKAMYDKQRYKWNLPLVGTGL